MLFIYVFPPRPYTVNLVPAIAKICQRNNEESVQETLAIFVSKLMLVLGQFASDKEIKILLKAFLSNLVASSAIVRRAAALSLTSVCLNSRRPSSFFSWILLALFDLILPVHDDHSTYVILGVLLCLRHIVPHLSEAMMSPNSKSGSIIQNEEEMIVTKEQLLKIYKLVLHFSNHPDHNVIAATLETLYHLLKCAPKVLQHELTSPYGITKSLIFDVPKLNRAMSESQYSMVPSLASIDEAALEDDQDLFVAEKQIDDQLCYYDDEVRSNLDTTGDSSLSLDGDSEDAADNSNLRSRSNGVDMNYFGASSEGIISDKKEYIFKKGASDESILDTDDGFWEHNSASSSPGPLTKIEFKIGNIGTFTDHDIPLKYCTRLLCSSFLLTGTPGGFMSDRNVRISVKSLAIGCLSSVFSLFPSGFLLPLHNNISSVDDDITDEQRIWDVILYASHLDPHIRGQTCVMIGSFLGHALREAGGWWSKWVKNDINAGVPSLPTLLLKILYVIQDDSSVASKLGLLGLKQCLNVLLNSVDALESFPILETLLKVQSNSYWLTKVELTELVSSISFKVVHYLESKRISNNMLSVNTCYQDKVLKDILIPLLGDEDVRVRQASAVAFCKLVSNLFYPIDHLNKDPVIAIAKQAVDAYLDVSHKSSLHSTLPLVHALVKPFAVYDSISYNPVIDAALSKIINLLVNNLRMCTNKYLITDSVSIETVESSVRVLNIFTHVLEEQYPFPASSRSALPSFTKCTIIKSNKKRKNKTKDESQISGTIIKGSPTKGTEKGESEKTELTAE
ncbi:huntingtin [Caerostris extrusa]|uniref:Huntingtin n=1 Tax=Caerostris extrusa TaxID=172846 RepID=A0AAV4NHD6_CAEEX|nr:huntingtin [Caerostris extrusa]